MKNKKQVEMLDKVLAKVGRAYLMEKLDCRPDTLSRYSKGKVAMTFERALILISIYNNLDSIDPA